MSTEEVRPTMSRDQARQAKDAAENHLQELRVDSLPRRHSHHPSAHYEKSRVPKSSSRSTEYVFVNQAFHGSTHSVAQTPRPRPRISPAPIQSEVIREQYWACSKWSLAQRILAVSVGILLGAVVGLVVAMVINGKTADEVIGGIFNNARHVPD